MKIALLGYGKMGKTIERLALEKGYSIVYKRSSTDEEGELTEAEVAIDFSTPSTAEAHIVECIKLNIPIVSGTTGWLEAYHKILKLCETRNGSFIYASNFSIGVNLFFTLNEYLAKLMKPWNEYSVAIEEIHHTQKLDAPSGTAISLAEGIIEHTDKQQWKLDSSSKEDVPITAKRIDDVKGTHNVTYSSPIDTISITHQAHTRDGFALGALLAAAWLKDKKGVFTMKDVLKIT